MYHDYTTVVIHIKEYRNEGRGFCQINNFKSLFSPVGIHVNCKTFKPIPFNSMPIL